MWTNQSISKKFVPKANLKETAALKGLRLVAAREKKNTLHCTLGVRGREGARKGQKSGLEDWSGAKRSAAATTVPQTGFLEDKPAKGTCLYSAV